MMPNILRIVSLICFFRLVSCVVERNDGPHRHDHQNHGEIGATRKTAAHSLRSDIAAMTLALLFALVVSATASPVLQHIHRLNDNPEEHDAVYVSHEKRLIKKLLDRYNRTGIYGRPVENKTVTLTVEYGIGLIQILDLDEKDQVLTSNIWCRYKWLDILLQWNPELFGGVETVRIPSNQIWKPDIVLYNYADERLIERRPCMAVVSYTGDVLWIPMAIFKSTCKIDITHFPFDEQSCFLKFGSWTYDGYQLDIIFFAGKKHVELNDYTKSPEWEVIEAPAMKNVKRYPCCDEPFPDLTFFIKIRRKVAFYNYILLLPCVLLSTLTLVLFWLPPESVAKMILGMNIFVAFFLLLLLLADTTPPAASEIPLIGAYYCINMMLITLSTFLSVFVIQLYFRNDRRNHVPPMLKKIMIEWTAKLLGMKGEMKVLSQPIEIPDDEEVPLKETPRLGPRGALTKRRRSIDLALADKKCGRCITGHCLPVTGLYEDVHIIRRTLKVHTRRLAQRDAINRIATEWRMVARVFDRLFFYLYLVAIMVSLSTIFPRQPTSKPIAGLLHSTDDE